MGVSRSFLLSVNLSTWDERVAWLTGCLQASWLPLWDGLCCSGQPGCSAGLRAEPWSGHHSPRPGAAAGHEVWQVGHRMAPPRLLIGSDPDPLSPDGAQSSLWPLVLVRRSTSSLWIQAEHRRDVGLPGRWAPGPAACTAEGPLVSRGRCQGRGAMGPAGGSGRSSL